LSKFQAHQADILIGTQMVAKGLHIPKVTLVGVVSADTGLNLPDFRAGERTFQLLSQVAGRAGRGTLGGRVIIQTYTSEHYAIQAAATARRLTSAVSFAILPSPGWPALPTAIPMMCCARGRYKG
jgi:primosomal protein N'